LPVIALEANAVSLQNCSVHSSKASFSGAMASWHLVVSPADLDAALSRVAAGGSFTKATELKSTPIAIVAAIRTSGISERGLEELRRIVAPVWPAVTGTRGCAAVVMFGEEVAWLQDFTSDADAVSNAMARVRKSEATGWGIDDAVLEGLERLTDCLEPRRVLLVISGSAQEDGSEVAGAVGVELYMASYAAEEARWTGLEEAIAAIVEGLE
jgi:hypothetical protein